jgi:hypothetical protein
VKEKQNKINTEILITDASALVRKVDCIRKQSVQNYAIQTEKLA